MLFEEIELDRRLAETDHRERGDDPTPRSLASAIVDAGMVEVWRARPTYMDRATLKVRDEHCGYGCFSSVLRAHAKRIGYQVHITGSEIYAPRREHMAKWCDRVLIGNWLDTLDADGELDLAMGNPDFEALVGETPEQSMPAILLERARAVLLLHQSNSFQRGLVGAEVWRRYPPAFVWLVPGSVRFRVGTNPKTGKPWGADSRCYQASLWLRGHSGDTVTRMLPSPPDGSASWRWTVPPGSEEPSEELPAAPGWVRP